MSANFWNDIDTTLRTTVNNEMGAGSVYTNQKLRTVQVVDQWDAQLVESAVGDLRLPACFIIGRSWEPGNNIGFEPQGPGWGKITLNIAYSYDLVVATDLASTYTQALQNVKELIRRLREMCRANWTLGGLTSTDGEVIIELHLGQAEVDVQGYEGGQFIGGGYLPITVYSQI